MIVLSLFDVTHPNGQGLVWTWPSNAYPNLTDYVEIRVEHWGSGEWHCLVYLDIRLGPVWGLSRSFATQEEASREAADAWAECARIVHAHWRGAPIATPWRSMGEAFDALPEVVVALDRIAVLRGERRAIDYGSTAWMSERRRLTDEACRIQCELREQRTAWFRATDWRAHRDGMTAPQQRVDQPRGQLVLTGCS